jgi:hypothetical protein
MTWNGSLQNLKELLEHDNKDAFCALKGADGPS